ncbi:RAP domain-containing protein [Cardiosporidium cionae]|uniref:RAP domain-containing protein n=1 Tax=Cardiosporidium cionae TaxID=476202 RepID=A0ABQ7J7Q4_9APIC|nr:RAP domain-containing protein [Cardiosporidium cionae]|eukprot:KAF8820017.1 RAP domain-containing protein [Cardiosporidium cionae]
MSLLYGNSFRIYLQQSRFLAETGLRVHHGMPISSYSYPLNAISRHFCYCGLDKCSSQRHFTALSDQPSRPRLQTHNMEVPQSMPSIQMLQNVHEQAKNRRQTRIVDITSVKSNAEQGVPSPLANKYRSQNLKPHEVRKLLKKEDQQKQKPSDKSALLKGLSKSAFSKGHLISELGDFENGSTETNTNKFSFLPNHFGTKGTYANKGSEYYKMYFQDRDRQLDGTGFASLSNLGKEMDSLDKETEVKTSYKSKGIRLSPKKYWYSEEYESPSPGNIADMKSKQLKFVMMNEARVVRKESAIDLDLWTAFMKRVLKLLRRVDLRTLLRFLQCCASVQLPLDYHSKELIMAINERRALMKPKHYIMLFQGLSRIAFRDQNIIKNMNDMTLCWPILRNNYLIKAANSLAKLDVASHILFKPLQMTLAQRISGFSGHNCVAIKWITVLEVFDESMTVGFLQKCERYTAFFKNYSRNLQIVELYIRLIRPDIYNRLPSSSKVFLETCRHTADNAIIKGKSVEMDQRRLGRKSRGESLPMSDIVPSSYWRNLPTDLGVDGNESNAYKNRISSENYASQVLPQQSKEETPFICSQENTPLGGNKGIFCKIGESPKVFTPQLESKNVREGPSSIIMPSYSSDNIDPLHNHGSEFSSDGHIKKWSSPLHADISRLLLKMGLQHMNSITAGPFLLDIFHPPSNYIIEALPAFQFYAETTRITAHSRRRNELLHAMGFSVIGIPHQRWYSFDVDEDRIKYLEQTLPVHILKFRPML